ncbi:hypothetical protein A2856_03320 [Candidatus Uhrbacteria bacterium RIFCSPHIGHO2_01_FULL_63_20]|uniref:PPM-type phosphatase domain-containing protein n=1 Tax=Candidatus Uhrbacteria bacterium RIFCSPHIGHO2_01_FULL_63_20 TaxID=1802385 RepID=A0A1F7TLC2_9BACT|nr:MAG: hypothetical protein A2856_03320 [Candidatus Uhrbacteria bacterium RIFCSPHIGHO2_01_FULL_63_20]
MEPNTRLKAGTYADPSPSPAAPRTTLWPLSGRDGFVFALCLARLKRPSPDANLLCRTVEEQVQRLSASFGAGDHAQHRFEEFLSSLNASVSELVRATEWSLPIKEFHALVGIACEEEMYLSGTGDLAALFLHRTPDQRYQVFNLSRGIHTEQALPTWEKPFAVVLDGSLHPGDVFCVASKDLAPAVGNDELCAILSTLPPAGAAARIRQYFAFNDVLSVLVLRVEADEPETTQAKPKSEVSLSTLAASREETRRLIEDQAPNASLLLSLWQRVFRRAPASDAPRPRSLSRVVHGLLGAGKALVAAGLWTGRATVDVTRADGRARIVRETRLRADEVARGWLRRAGSVPNSSRYLALAAVVVLVAFGVSISVLSSARARHADDAAFETRLAAASELREEAAAAAIYRDEDRARVLYTEALTTLASVAAATRERQEAVAKIVSDIEAALDQLRHVVRLSDLPRFASLEGARALVKVGTNLYAFTAAREVVRVDPVGKTATALPLPDASVGAAREASADETAAYFLDDRPGISLFDPELLHMRVTDLLPDAGNDWKDVAAYGDRLYVLESSPTDTQVQRFNATASGFGSPTGWIRSKTTPLADARSLAVDGSVFVLLPTGPVRFVSSGQSGWDASEVEPAMTDALDLWTDLESDRVYVLEPAQKRVMVFAKENGALLTQYVADAFTDATDLLVDETAQTIYVLTPDALYGFRTGQ